ncbi:zinc ribbon domain-containing protein [Megamonas sp.]|uniref:zinc-ribbon domain-containing protein n=1 Tax=Megamonas sp. TaxID=2049033 RepID=UPI002580A560|nr:zinc ribbon domain-containing protein [Megamonas sp.]MBS5781136.1 zinc-ribbon domain-containing protein [Megamonas sp.]
MIIIFCPNCGNQINDNEKFCSKCGNQIKQDNNEQMKQSEKTISDNVSQNVDAQKSYTKYKYIGIFIAVILLLGLVPFGAYSYFAHKDTKQVEQNVTVEQNKENTASEDKNNAVKEDVKQPVEDIVNLEYTQNKKFIQDENQVAYFPDSKIYFQKVGKSAMLDDKNQVLMNFYVNTTMPDISIKEIKLANSDKLFYEVICTAGAHAKLEGYWLVGKKDGEWTVFISIDNLKSFGINPDKYYNMNNKIVNGKLIINCFHLEVPEGKSMAKGKKIDDCYIKVDWDNNKQTFRIY